MKSHKSKTLPVYLNASPKDASQQRELQTLQRLRDGHAKCCQIRGGNSRKEANSICKNTTTYGGKIYLISPIVLAWVSFKLC